MTLSVVQATGQPPSGGSSSSVSFTLDNTPVPGNLLVAFCAYNSGTATLTPPAGWSPAVDNQSNGASSDALAVMTHVVQAGDGKPWSFTTGGSPYTSGGLVEITGADTTAPVNQHAIANISGAFSNPSPSLTPSVLGCLALSCWMFDSFETFSSVTGGWTQQVSSSYVTGNYIVSSTASRDALTGDITTAISCTFAVTGGTSPGVTAAVLITPDTGSESGGNYAGSVADLGGGTGSWANPSYAAGTGTGSYATWTAP